MSTRRRAVAAVGLLAAVTTSCATQPTGTTNAASTELCGTRIGMNMVVRDARDAHPVTVDVAR